MSNQKIQKVVLVGGGGHAKSVIAVLKKLPDFSLVGYVDFVDHGNILGINYLGDDRILKKLLKKDGCRCAVLGVGNMDLSDHRQEIFMRLSALGFKFPVIVSPTSIINDAVKLGAGTVVLERVVLNASVRAGKACIFNTGSVVDHDCHIEDFVHVAPGAVISGGVKVGAGTLLGTGCRVIQNIKIAKGCLVGAGAVVVKDIKKSGTYLGVPARLVKY